MIEDKKIKKFVVMGGCDGRHKEREYFTELAKKLPKEALILTCGCAKFRYNMLDLEGIDNLPKVIDAGQCNDAYALGYIALRLKEKLGLEDINKLPISLVLGWYEQKAALVLLSLLALGFKNIKIGPRPPSFLSSNILKILKDKFGLEKIKTVEDDLKDIY